MYTWYIVKNGISHQDDLQMTETETHGSSAVPLHLTPEGRRQIHQSCLLSEMMFPSLIQASIQCYYSLLQAHRLLFQRVREDFLRKKCQISWLAQGLVSKHSPAGSLSRL